MLTCIHEMKGHRGLSFMKPSWATLHERSNISQQGSPSLHGSGLRTFALSSITNLRKKEAQTQKRRLLEV